MKHKFNNPKHYLQPLFIWLLAGFNHAALANLPPVVVKTYGEHVGGNIIYHHQVTNNGTRDVVGIAIGLNTDQVGITGATREQGELNFVTPIGMEPFQRKINLPLISGPTGWDGEMIKIEHTGKYLQWYSPKYPQPALLPGQTLRFSVTVPGKIDDAYLIKHFSVRLSDLSEPPSGAAYLTGHFSANYADGKDPWHYNGAMEKLDTIPPTLTITPTPATLWPPNNKMVAVTVAITVKDDYDPQPEIKLESITSSEVLAPGEIQGAVLGSDDRQFSLAAEREGSNLAGRVYTLTYSATDGSGNKSTASTTVTVPHDQR